MKSKTRLAKGDPNKAVKELAKINNRLAKSLHVVAGLPKDSNPYPDGTSVILVGLVHEFGSPRRGVPERSFIRATARDSKRELVKASQRVTKNVLRGKHTKEKGLNLLGVLLQSKIQQTLTKISAPVLKHRVGNPLIDTGHLRQSITYQVRKGEVSK